MDFSFTEEQQAAVEAARAVFSGVAPDGVPSPTLVPGAVDPDFDRALWGKLADAGLISLPIDPDPIALCLVLRESAKVLARVPLLETGAAALAIRLYGSEALRDGLLPRIARGEAAVTVAAHGRTGHEPAERAVVARREGDAWLLDGVQTAVPYARTCDHVLIPAHTPEGRAVLALIPRTAEGLTLASQVSTSGEPYAELHLDTVRTDPGSMITAEGAADWLHRLLATGTCALALGLGEMVLLMTSEYTSKREQFGFPVATFQAVAMQAADRYIDLRAMEATLWQAAWRLAPTEVAVAKIWAAEGVRRTVQTAQHLHGGLGSDTDYPLHRYHAWAKQLELSLGPAAAHEETLGELLAAQST
ncbi:acyl-CoA dehydrogenase family protein [Streptomyces gobiensis]|uniref:acyl-CoA dehydrogenase family protein n=1 Tax=Streptomyces gobiensis TaxID=2875706 RepID=UPI001E5F5F70|nr:acyl-CoA dehydrogenase family protein [Streptomyces gobiensis]UGY92616.1 acyl-CoA/acyl-ACP dehydrogenase [Streptomyces gobiensis]